MPVMKKMLAFFLCALLANQTLDACTTFLIHKNGKYAFGRNYDWITDVGMVCSNLRGLAKTSAQINGQPTVSWVSKYGSITFNQYGKEFPTGGMNERGLVVEMMWLDGSKYPEPDSRAEIGVLQWIQYQLDNCSTIEEVIATNSKIRISKTHPPVHYLVADLSGRAATIEFLDGNTVVHTGTNLSIAVLTNTDYATSERVYKQSINSKDTNVAFNDNSLQRFAAACSMVQQYNAGGSNSSLVDYSFDVLKKVSNDDFTKWSIVYDMSAKKVYFKSKSSPQVKWISYADVDFSCNSTSLAFDMNLTVQGNGARQFKPLTKETSTILLNRAATESKSQINIGEADIRRDVEYASRIKCQL